ncbi:hypothetical protein Purlil1_12386 [Purpureocillium lilacinum]|uniref:Uncharacterized protein n=1 Tax=Purpureocillium lilacinum TaxID=33203 RepID=A0ABR0BH39_PURLI|nr:hypothetical protein Purlil1_12386 [Purpureocillium lilacinum]
MPGAGAVLHPVATAYALFDAQRAADASREMATKIFLPSPSAFGDGRKCHSDAYLQTEAGRHPERLGDFMTEASRAWRHPQQQTSMRDGPLGGDQNNWPREEDTTEAASCPVLYSLSQSRPSSTLAKGPVVPIVDQLTLPPRLLRPVLAALLCGMPPVCPTTTASSGCVCRDAASALGMPPAPTASSSSGRVLQQDAANPSGMPPGSPTASSSSGRVLLGCRQSTCGQPDCCVHFWPRAYRMPPVTPLLRPALAAFRRGMPPNYAGCHHPTLRSGCRQLMHEGCLQPAARTVVLQVSCYILTLP